MRGDGRGDLDRDVVDVVSGQQTAGALHPACCLLLPEDRLAQEVDIEADAFLLLADPRDGRPESTVAGVDDEVADHAAQREAGGRHDEPGRDAADDSSGEHGRTQRQRQELRHQGRQRRQVAGRGLRVLRSDHAVDEADGEGEPVGVLQNSGEALCSGVDRLVAAGLQPAADQSDRLVGQLLVDPGAGRVVRFHGDRVLFR
nr:hypothetical protein [Nocardioides daphniae]